MAVEYTLALRALMEAEKAAGREYGDPACVCEHVDIGIGLMKVDEVPDCPMCTPFGFAWWASEHGTEDEQRLAKVYLDEFLGPR